MLRGVVEQQGSTMFPQPVNLLMNVKPAIQVKSQSQLIKPNWNAPPPPPSQWLSMKKDQVDQKYSFPFDVSDLGYDFQKWNVRAFHCSSLHKRIDVIISNLRFCLL